MSPHNFRRGFTLIEIMVTIGIIIILATVMIAVAGNVRQNARIKECHTTLTALEGILETYERESGQKIVTGTVYRSDGTIGFPTAAGTSTVFTILARHPATKDLITKLGGERLRLINGQYELLDAFEHPIHYMPTGWSDGTVVNAASASNRTCFRSSGPDKESNFTTPSASVNNDDIYSYEAAR